MIVNLGKRIKVETLDFKFERDADSPGLVKVRKSRGENEVIGLPANKVDAEAFIAAYRRCVSEEIEYRNIED